MNWKENQINDLNAPFRWPWAVSKLFCVQCGHISEIDSQVAHSLVKVMGILGSFPEISLNGDQDFKKYYFEVGYCKHCRRTDVSVKLKEIKQGLN